MILESWFALIASLPTGNTALRMRFWRGMKSVGAMPMRDGVWLLPLKAELGGMRGIAAELVSAGGEAEILQFTSRDDAQEARLRGLFDRTADYGQLREAIQMASAVNDSTEGERQLRRLRRELAHLAAIDFFPGPGREETEAAMRELERRIFPDEPGREKGGVLQRDAADYQGRLWATRARPWVDRLASAWLIARHIDRKARFLWLASPADCPAEALGFDFDGATFSHIGERVTFETLLASFGLEDDAALLRLGRIVHTLDVGGSAPEAAGLECVLRGLRARHADDDTLLKAAGQVFDDLHMIFLEELNTA